MDDAPLLEVKDLSIAFGQQEAVRGISFQINPGETLGLVGESGSGKSAASMGISRLLPPPAEVGGGGGIWFQINPGGTVGLVGESGSGKSAASMAISRLLPPTATVGGGVRFG